MKSIKKVFIVMVIVSLAFGIIGLNYSYAGEGSISVSSAKKGQEFTVTVSIPCAAVAYQGKIEVTFSDNTTQSSGPLAKATGTDGVEMAFVGNITTKFKAPSAGNAKVKVTGLIISGKNSEQLNTQTSLEKTFNVEDVQAPAPSQPPKQENPKPPETNTTKPTTQTEDPGFTKTGDKVYALEKVNVRKSATSTAEKLGSLNKDQSTTRISVGPNGWDKIQFNGGTGYVVSKYLTTQSPEERAKLEPKWTNTGDTVYSLAKLNVRKGWGTSYESMGSLKVADEVKRIATGDNGWDKIEYKGEKAYVMSKYLTTSKDEAEKLLEDENEVEENTTVENTVNNTTAENTTVNEATAEPTDEYNTIVKELGVIPQVGKSSAGRIYYISVIVAIVMVALVGLKIRDKSEDEE